ncbi:MAG TPA: tetratricopeptide repeat protein [Chitinophagaceae bacterium]
MRKILVFILLLLVQKTNSQSACFEKKEHPMPALSEQAKTLYSTKLTEAKANYDKDSLNADNIIWLGRRTAYLGKYSEAIAIFTKGIQLHPADARFYRHRGHRYITLRCFDKAIADFKKAAALIKGKSDEVEPDGLPNAKNIPTSTLQSNIWYHLGLCYYIKGEYKAALTAYKNCLAVSTNNDMYVATANWLNITLRKLGKKKEADDLVATIDDKMELIENKDYHQLLLLYKHDTDLADPVNYLQAGKKDLGLASFGFGLGNYLLQKGKKKQAREIFEMITASDQWASFGYIAAEAELARMK